MNAEGARIERRLGKPILARLHAAASFGMAIGAILGSLIVASAAPWASGLVAAIGLAAAGLAYGGAARGEGEAQPPATASRARGLSFTPALIGLGIVIGLSVAAETAASLWSTLLLRAEAPKLAAIAGLGAAFFAVCQATLRFNADFIRLRFSDERIIVGSFALAAAGFAVVAAKGGFAASVAGFALIGVGTGAIVPCSFALAARADGDPAGGRPVVRVVVQRVDPPAGPARDRGDRAELLSSGRLRRLRRRARGGVRRHGCVRAVRRGRASRRKGVEA